MKFITSGSTSPERSVIRRTLATSKRKKYEQEKETGYIIIQKGDASISK